jgi:hypothetical protein
VCTLALDTKDLVVRLVTRLAGQLYTFLLVQIH